ncbi:hypothetical protein [Paenibacillus sp. FSL R7-0273]|uniref:hypothetical protein n=1 Tax=Paenibacillus sp. FSL R7-0273 TaxID=1536772 RepID=UPI0012E03043|nr:hypothetical protein [Paenibacillus sp. FSL R7-0273]
MKKEVVLSRFGTEQEALSYRFLAQQIHMAELFVANMPDDYNPGEWAVYYFR